MKNIIVSRNRLLSVLKSMVNASKLYGIPYDYGNLSLQTHQRCVIPAEAGTQDDAYTPSVMVS